MVLQSKYKTPIQLTEIKKEVSDFIHSTEDCFSKSLTEYEGIHVKEEFIEDTVNVKIEDEEHIVDNENLQVFFVALHFQHG